MGPCPRQKRTRPAGAAGGRIHIYKKGGPTMSLGKKTVEDQNYQGKRVLVRCDFNVPMKDGEITDIMTP